jgi:hypothetical protein
MVPTIISPQANPPPDVVQQVFHTPPPSLPPLLPYVTLPVVSDEDMAGIEAKEKVAAVVEEEKHEENGNETEREMAWLSSLDSSIVPSSATSVIDNSTHFTVPGSPATVRYHSKGTKSRLHQPRLRRLALF